MCPQSFKLGRCEARSAVAIPCSGRRQTGFLAWLGASLRIKLPRRKAPGNDRVATVFSFLILTFVLSVIDVWAVAPQKKLAWDGSRITPVHQIPIKDELDQVIVPAESYPLPYSSRYTCEPCHDYKVIQQGLHFNEATATKPGRAGEPWIWADEKTGTLLPLSYRNWKGVWNPKDLGLTSWDFTLLFARHMTGGGIAEPDDKDMTPASRWNVSGKLEINCMGCHNASQVQSHSEWAKQVLRENFRWAATAASGMGEVGGMSSRLKGTWDVFDGPNPDDSEWAVAPSVRYNKNLFDSKHRVLFEIAYKPEDSRCLACHSAAPAEMKKFNFDEDVHSAAGHKCVACHRNDLGHAMVRGYEGEAQDNPALPAEDFTCAGCHLGGKSSSRRTILPGRLGAPYPLHKGIPKVHFDRLSCTVCHSGPMPAKEAVRVRTSRANRLGIYGVAQWATGLPAVLEPVYIRDKNKKLTPHRLIWPAYWAELEDKKISPLKPEEVLAAAGDILSPEKTATRILTALFNIPELDGTPLLIMDGKAYELNVDGGLDASPYLGVANKPELFWAVKKSGKITRLVPGFNPDVPDAAAEAEAQIQKILEALKNTEAAPGQPVCVYNNLLYRIVESYIDKSEFKGESQRQPQLFWLKDDQTRPFVSEYARRTIGQLTGTGQTLTEEQVGLILKALREKRPANEAKGTGEYVYISGGKLFRLDENDTLEAKNDDAAKPAAWPMAHQVRPARQSLGVNGCTDCHKAGSSFFFGKVAGTGPLATKNVLVRSASSFMGLTKPYYFLFGLSFTVRPVLKWILFAAAIIIGSILFLVFLLALGRLSGLIDKRS